MINSWQYSKNKDKYKKKVSIKQISKLNSMPFSCRIIYKIKNINKTFCLGILKKISRTTSY